MKPTLSFETQGEIIAIDETQNFANGFSKREFIIKVPDGDYPQDVKFEMVKDRADVLESLNKGDTVNVAFNLRGNEYNGKYYVNLQAWKVTLEEKASNQPAPAKEPELAPAGDEDDIPL